MHDLMVLRDAETPLPLLAARGDGLGSQVACEASQLVRERWGGPTFVRGAGGLVRTPDEDDGVMVLLHGPSAGVGLAAAISCEARPGDDW